MREFILGKSRISSVSGLSRLEIEPTTCHSDRLFTVTQSRQCQVKKIEANEVKVVNLIVLQQKKDSNLRSSQKESMTNARTNKTPPSQESKTRKDSDKVSHPEDRGFKLARASIHTTCAPRVHDEMQWTVAWNLHFHFEISL